MYNGEDVCWSGNRASPCQDVDAEHTGQRCTCGSISTLNEQYRSHLLAEFALILHMQAGPARSGCATWQCRQLPKPMYVGNCGDAW